MLNRKTTLQSLISNFYNPTFISTIIYSLFNLFVVKFISNRSFAASNLFVFSSIQTLSQFISIFLFYGYFIEQKNSLKKINPFLIIITSIIFYFIFPALSILFFLLMRGMMMKFSQKESHLDKISISFILIAIFLFLYNSNSLKYFAISLILSHLIFLFFKNSTVLFPVVSIKELKISFISNTAKRCFTDYMIILAPFLINIYVKNFYEDRLYVIFQLSLTSLSFSSLLSGVIERKSFDKYLKLKNEDVKNEKKDPTMLYLIIISIISVLILAFFLKIPFKYFMFLSFNAAISPLFSHIYNRCRFLLPLIEINFLGILLCLNVIFMILINYYIFLNSLLFLLFSMSLIAIINIIYLNYKLQSIKSS